MWDTRLQMILCIWCWYSLLLCVDVSILAIFGLCVSLCNESAFEEWNQAWGLRHSAQLCCLIFKGRAFSFLPLIPGGRSAQHCYCSGIWSLQEVIQGDDEEAEEEIRDSTAGSQSQAGGRLGQELPSVALLGEPTIWRSNKTVENGHYSKLRCNKQDRFRILIVSIVLINFLWEMSSHGRRQLRSTAKFNCRAGQD